MADSAVGADRGAATTIVLVLVAFTLSLTMVLLAWAAALQTRQRAESAADLVALAAAAAHVRGSDGCAAAARVSSQAAGARPVALVGCVVESDGSVSVLVELESPWSMGLSLPPARARARAGGTW